MIRITDNAPSQFTRSVIKGLSRPRKSIPSKYLYDEEGSRLFDRICEVDEYYVTRTEASIMQAHVGEMVEMIGAEATLVELGSGSSQKTRWLLRESSRLHSYIPLDISDRFLQQSANQLGHEFPHLKIQPCTADFTKDLPRLQLRHPGPVVFYCPGSTIGNLSTTQSLRLLQQMAQFRLVEGDANNRQRRCGLLIGIDLQKEPSTIEAAYNDREGVTAAFSKNLLARINRELDGDFDLAQFEHQATYDSDAHQVNIGLLSLRRQRVRVADHTFEFAPSELIHTEVSRKYRVDQFSQLALRAGFQLRGCWTDARRYFAVLYFEVPTGPKPR